MASRLDKLYGSLPLKELSEPESTTITKDPPISKNKGKVKRDTSYLDSETTDQINAWANRRRANDDKPDPSESKALSDRDEDIKNHDDGIKAKMKKFNVKKSTDLTPQQLAD